MSEWLGPVGRELRQGAGAELRADAEETERLVSLAARRRRTLGDVAASLLARGDTIAVDVPGRRFTGTVVHAGADLLRLATPGGAVDVNLRGAVALQVVERAPSGGSERSDGPPSFRSRLSELELAGTTVELGDHRDGLVGRIAVVAVDHLVLLDPTGAERYVALATLTYVRPR